MKDSSNSGFLSSLEFYEFLGLIILVGAVIKYMPLSFLHQDWGSTLTNFWLLLPDYSVLVMLRLFALSFFVSLILLVIIIWTSHKIIYLRKKMHDSIELQNNKTDNSVTPAMRVNEKWENVIKHINSDNPSDWKLAILECDIMLADILEKMGYLQPSISEKLKSIEPSDFTNIEAAWEAHKIRNSIAHEGSDFMINEREAKRVVGLYEAVFREFSYI